MRSVTLLLIATLLAVPEAGAQSPRQRKPPPKVSPNALEVQARTPQQVEIRKLFGLIEQGIENSSLSSASAHFAEQVFVTMSEGESGYYSASQTVSMLQRYLSSRNSLSFQFSRYSDAGTTPYATGRLSFNARGRRESAQIYVSLRFQRSKWVISQFNIY